MFDSWGVIGSIRLQSGCFPARLELIVDLLIACSGREIERIVQSSSMDMNRPFQLSRCQ